jgi:hypothetical protein
MRALTSNRVTLLALLPGFLAACGGSTLPAESGSSGAAPHAAAHESSANESAAERTSAAPLPERATCDDGTCSPCGDSLCPTGWYCDETAKGGPSCGWLPECAQKSGCACVKKALGCACEEKAGGAHVSCS